MSKSKSLKITTNTDSHLIDWDHPDCPYDPFIELKDKATIWALVVPCKDKKNPWRNFEIIPISQDDLDENWWLEKHIQNITLCLRACNDFRVRMAFVINSTPKPESKVISGYLDFLIGENFEPFCDKRDALQPWLEALPDSTSFLAGCFDLEPVIYKI